MSRSIVAEKSFLFAHRILNLSRELRKRRVERELCSQLLRSGTSIAANLTEAQYGHSSDEFAYRVRISLRECAETEMWLRLLHVAGNLRDKEFESIHDDCVELLKMLTSISVTLQRGQNDQT